MTLAELIEETEVKLSKAKLDLVFAVNMWGEKVGTLSHEPNVLYLEAVLTELKNNERRGNEQRSGSSS